MSKQKGIIWVARPEPQASQLAQAFASSGFAAIAAPVMNITPITDWEVPTKKPDAIIITSQHAVAALNSLPKEWKSCPVYVVGRRTKASVREAGWSTRASKQMGALPMLEMLEAQQSEGASLLYFSGDVLRWDIPTLLADKHYKLKRVEVYRAKAVEQLPEAVQHAIGEDKLAGITCYSPRTAQIAAQLLRDLEQEEALANTTALCLSDDIAQAAQKAGFQKVAVSHGQDEAAMVELAATLTNQPEEPLPMRRQLSGMFIVLVALIALTGLLAWQNVALEKKLAAQPTLAPTVTPQEQDDNALMETIRAELQGELSQMQEEARTEMETAIEEMEAALDELELENTTLKEEQEARETAAKEKAQADQKAAQKAELDAALANIPKDFFYSWYALRHAFGNGKPYSAELAAVQAALPEALNQTPQMQTLLAGAERPAPTRDMLTQKLVEALDSAPKAAPVTVIQTTPDDEVGVMARMQHLLNEHVSITRVEDADTEALINAAREHIKHDEIEIAARLLRAHKAPWPELQHWLNVYEDMHKRRMAVRQLGNIIARFKEE